MLFSEMMKGKSLLRTLTNKWLSNLTIEGNGIDLGAKNEKSSYYRFIKKSNRIIYDKKVLYYFIVGFSLDIFANCLRLQCVFFRLA